MPARLTAPLSVWEAEKEPWERVDDLQFRGRHLLQDTREFCFGMDAVLLARFAHFRHGARVLDLGTGTGVIPLLLADEAHSVLAIEQNPRMVQLARRNVRLNGLAEQIQVLEGDVKNFRQLYPAESFDVTLMNPPYYPLGNGKQSLQTGKAQARHEITATLKDFLQAARWGLRFGGKLFLIHVPTRLDEILIALQVCQFGVNRLRLVYPMPKKEACLVLLEASVGKAQGHMKILPPLFVREETGEYSAEILQWYYRESRKEDSHAKS